MNPTVGNRSSYDIDMTDLIRSAFIRERQFFEPSYRPSPVHDGGYDRLGRKRKPIWETIEKFLTSNSITEHERVEAYISFACRECGILYPNQLCSRNILNKFLEQEEESNLREQERMILELRSARAAMSVPGNRETLLLAVYSGNPYKTVLARAFLAKCLGDHDIARELELELAADVRNRPKLYELVEPILLEVLQSVRQNEHNVVGSTGSTGDHRDNTG